MSSANPRTVSARVVAGVIRGEGSLNSLLAPALDKVAPRDRNLVQALCYGTLRQYPALDALLSELLDKPLRAKDAEITALLAGALHQLRAMRTPDHAAVNETVAACRGLKRPWAKGLVNGVLRRFLRERETLEARLADEPRYRTAHPDWLRLDLEEAWPDQASAIFQAANQQPPMTLRINRRRQQRSEYLAKLTEAGLAARAGAWAESALYLETATTVDNLPGFGEGEVSVQDEAAQLAAPLLDPQPGDRVLDACCAPGGKTGHLLEYQPELAELVGLDSDAARLEKVDDNLRRLHLHARLQAARAENLDSWWDGEPFDRILIDAPCSGSGVIRRHPDIKLLRRPEDIGKLAALQGELLASLWRTLKPGGRLLYATCSVLPRENDGVIADFAQGRADCHVRKPRGEWGQATAWGRQLLPENTGPDGFYYALLEKRQ